MKAPITPQADEAVTGIAQRHGISREAALTMLSAVHAGGGTMAQFSIPELGGSGQWMQSGMTMVGNMFDNALKVRVEALCAELSQLLATTTVFSATGQGAVGGFSAGNWWPAELGTPSSSGGQNDARYAVFPGLRRLAIHFGGVTRIFDIADHQIGGVQQQQGGGLGTVMFTSQLGTFAVNSLREIKAGRVDETPADASESLRPSVPSQNAEVPTQSAAASARPSVPPSAQPAQSGDPAAIIAAIESLAGLHQRGILTAEEFAAKKADLLARL